MTWEVGDLAVCVPETCAACTDGNSPESEGPEDGDIVEVEAVLADPSYETDGLAIVGYPNPDGFCICGFRKVVRYQERFAEQLRTALPTKERVS